MASVWLSEALHNKVLSHLPILVKTQSLADCPLLPGFRSRQLAPSRPSAPEHL